MKVKKGDTVLVIAGKDKGAKGKVIQAYPESDRVLVEGVNRIKKHTKVSSTERGAKSGGIVSQEAGDPRLAMSWWSTATESRPVSASAKSRLTVKSAVCGFRVVREGSLMAGAAKSGVKNNPAKNAAGKTPKGTNALNAAPARGAAKVSIGKIAEGKPSGSAGTPPRLKTRYATEIKPSLNTEFAYANVMQIRASSRSSSTLPAAELQQRRPERACFRLEEIRVVCHRIDSDRLRAGERRRPSRPPCTCRANPGGRP